MGLGATRGKCPWKGVGLKVHSHPSHSRIPRFPGIPAGKVILADPDPWNAAGSNPQNPPGRYPCSPVHSSGSIPAGNWDPKVSFFSRLLEQP